MASPFPWGAGPGFWYGPYAGPPPMPQYGTLAPMAPPPPPPYSPYGYGYPPAHGYPTPPTPPQRIDQDDDKLYKSPDVARLKVHVIQLPAAAVFSRGGPGSFTMARYKLPLSMSIPDVFKKLGAFKGKKVIEEAVEEGNGIWLRGAKLVWGCQDVKTVGDVRWRRGGGLSAAADEAVWVVVREKTDDD